MLLEREPRGRAAAFYATGTVHNTCNHALVVGLELIGVDDAARSFSLPSPDPFALMPGEERPVFLPLGQLPVNKLSALMVTPRCHPEAGLGPAAKPPRCAKD